MARSLDPFTVQRLAYVRYLYREGIEQSRQPAPLRSRAITSFHDAVENYLGVITQHLGIDVAKAPDFIAYWTLIKEKFDLPKKDAMKRLNDARVALKHNGTFPSEHQIEQAHRTVEDFFTTVTPKVFGLDFDSIDMVDLLTQPDVARLVREAQTHADVGDYPHALAGLALAFDELLVHYAGTFTRPRTTVFTFGPDINIFDEPRVDGEHSRQLRRLKKLTDVALATQRALRAIALGIDYADLARFRIVTPEVTGYGDGSRRYMEGVWLKARTSDDYDWARHFVIESALRAARADEIQGMLKARYDTDWNPTTPRTERNWRGPLNQEEPAQASVFETDL
ncbi:hypothetical protein ACFZC3_15435 [Streptomyces sp. NPDC007903]|uniref:hypothetical protein n=1 Tax=Streptomyces sp. NPDC007903 TaxID=3364786 RepID=UPI0036E1AD66